MGRQLDSKPTPTNNPDRDGCLRHPMQCRKREHRSSSGSFPDCVQPCCMRHRLGQHDHGTKGMGWPASPMRGGKHLHRSSKLLYNQGVKEVNSGRALQGRRLHPPKLASVGPSEQFRRRRQGRPRRSPVTLALRLVRAHVGRVLLLAVVALPLHMEGEPSGFPARERYVEEMSANAASHD